MIELLLATALSALVFVLAANIFYTMFRVQEQQLEIDDNIEIISAFQSLIQLEIRQATKANLSSNKLMLTMPDSTKKWYEFKTTNGVFNLTYKVNGVAQDILDNVVDFNATIDSNKYVTYTLTMDENGSNVIYSASILPRIYSSDDPIINEWEPQ